MSRVPLSTAVLLLAGGLFFSLPLAINAQSYDWAFPGDRIEESEGSGLMLRSSPTNAKVYIDGIERGYTPLHLRNLSQGMYHVRMEKDGYSGRAFMARVKTGSLLDVSIELQQAIGRVLLNIQRSGDSPSPAVLPLTPVIHVDGTYYSSPALELPIGFRTILVRSFGWEDLSTIQYIEEDSYKVLDLVLKPAAFRFYNPGVSRPRFNPLNPGSLGTTTIGFEVSAPGTGTITVMDSDWNPVFTRDLNRFETWSQSVVWDGRDNNGTPLSDGVYTMVLEVVSMPWDDAPSVQDGVVLNLEIDSSNIINPLTMSSGKSGLLFAPFPEVLPRGSFQIEGSLLAGNPPEGGGSWKSLPFSVAFRLSPLERLELSGALNVVPHFTDDGTGLGFGAAAKWAYLNSADLPLLAAAGAAFSWTSGGSGLSPFGMASGIELFFPFGVDLSRLFSFALTPAVLWTGDGGFPWDAIPRLLVSAGFLMQMTYFNAGLSIRSEFTFSDSRPPYLMAGGEVKIFPPPSSFVFSVIGGVWIQGSDLGGFGGIGIGMIY